MAYQQVRDIVAHIKSLRGMVRAIVSTQSGQPSDAIYEALLGRIQEQDRYMEKCIDELTADASEGVLNTWIQFPDTQSIADEIADLSPPGDEVAVPTSEAVLEEQVLALEQRMLQLYQTAAEQSHSPRVQEFFRALAQMEDQMARAKSRSFNDADDLR